MKTAREPHPELIRSVVQQTVARLREQGPVRLVVGLPFYNEADTLPPLVRWLDARLCGAGRKEDTVLVAVGDPAGAACLHALRELPGDCRRQQLLLPGDAGGRGSSVRVLLSLARRLNADLVVLPADIAASDVEGEEPFPLRLAQAVEEGCDLALADRTRSGRVELVGGLLLHPLLESLYGCRLNDGRSMMFAVQRSLVGRLATEAEAWGEEIDGFGIDAWLLTRCLRWRRRVGEVEVAVPSEVGSLEKVAFVMRQVAAALFECIRRDDGSWWEDPHRVEVPVRWTSRAPASAGWGFAAVRVPEMMAHGVRRLHAYRPLLEATLQADVLAALQRAAARPAEPDFGPQAWRQAVEDLLLAFCFRPQWNREDILEALTAAFLFRAADCLERVRRRREAYMAAADAERPWQAQEEWAQVFHEQSQAFVAAGSEFRHRWRLVAAEAAPPITPLYALEFVPGVPVVLPDVLGNRRNRQVRAREVLQGVLKRWQQQFSRFVHLELGVPWSASGREIAERVGALMRELEGTLRELVPGDVHTPEGCRQVAEAWLALLPSRPVLALREEVLREMLARFPPALPSLQHGPGAGGTLHRPLDARDLVCLARLAEETAGISRGIAWALEDLRLEAMEFTPLRPLMLADIPEAGGIRLAGVSEWDGLAARLAIAPMSKAMGAAFPTLRFCLSLCYHVETAAGYSDMWAHFAADHRSMGRRIARSLESGASPAPFAAREVLESLHHRRVAAALSALAQVLEGTEHHRVAGLVRIAAAGYGLGMGAGDGVFVPCSVWTWAGYAHAGHPGLPTPLASVVERGAFNLAVLEGICQAMGFEQEDLTVLAWDMIGDGHGDESLLERWLGLAPAPVEAVVQAEPSGYPQAGRLRRVGSGPLLGPVAGHPWENRYVLNPGAVRLGDKVYLVYRAVGEDHVSRLGLAVTDGTRVLERLSHPIFGPGHPREARGCEDPRLVVIGDDIIMLYTAFDGVIAQIAAASIPVRDFIARRFDAWRRLGFAFEDITNKDALIFPELFDGRFVIYHRIEPSIWMTRLPELRFPVPRERHAIVMGPRWGRGWDSLKVGAGSQPLKTEFGWLLVYHGVDQEVRYHLGVLLVDPADPSRILYRSPNPVLSPETSWEVGGPEAWVHNVVFTCGAVPARDTAVLGAEDTVLVFYGAADTYVGVAQARVSELLPAEIRHHRS